MVLPSLDTRIGIWGFGRVGKSVLQILLNYSYQVAIMDTDRNILSDNELKKLHIPIFLQDQHDDFFAISPVVVPSPGIDLRPCASHCHTFLSELDLFQMLWKKPIIAITGSVGKTTVTSVLGTVLKYNNISALVGGNIGTAACTLLESTTSNNANTYALLEVSSFQLEYCNLFSPEIAVITNVYPNHLDRHQSLKDYWLAKAQIFLRQTKNAVLIAPLDLREAITLLAPVGQIIYTSLLPFQGDHTPILKDQETLIVYNQHKKLIQFYKNNSYQTAFIPETLFKKGLLSNMLTVYAVVFALTHNKYSLLSFDCDYMSYEHRLEIVATHNNVTFVNDSKATTIASTQAALAFYATSSIILLIGGLSKGVNREDLIAQLEVNVIAVICFGTEAALLFLWCQNYKKKSFLCSNLDDAFNTAVAVATSPSCILLSPAGSSYDLYANYEERGKHFKTLVNQFVYKS